MPIYKHERYCARKYWRLIANQNVYLIINDKQLNFTSTMYEMTYFNIFLAYDMIYITNRILCLNCNTRFKITLLQRDNFNRTMYLNRVLTYRTTTPSIDSNNYILICPSGAITIQYSSSQSCIKRSTETRTMEALVFKH